MTQTHVIIQDPAREYWEGGLVEGEVALVLRARGVITLPIEPALLQKSALAGYYRRSWGSGWPLSLSIPRMHCPMVLYAAPSDTPGQGRLNAVLRLVPDADAIRPVRKGARLAGFLQLAAESGQPGSHSGGFQPDVDTRIDVQALGPLDADDGWTVYAGGQLNVPADGFFSCALYGAAAGLRVAWCAISQSG
jgi:hypothetical protein